MNKRRFIRSLLALPLVPWLAGCDKDDEEEELIIVESFAGTDGMKGEKILFELKNVPAVVRYEQNGYVTVYYSKYADEYFKDNRLHCQDIKDIAAKRIGIALEEFNTYDIPFNSKIYISSAVTNITKFHSDDRDEFDWWFGLEYEEFLYKKAYLKDIRIR